MTDRSPIDRIIGARTEKPLPRPALWTGLYTGTLLVMVMFGALVAANRLPWLDNRALERNAASYGLFVIFMLIPVVRFLNRPIQMFTSAMIAWVMFVLAYDIAGMLFRNLFQVLRTPFQAFIEGALAYGVFAVGSWVGAMVLQARHHAITARRRHNDPAAHHR
ncbi:MAG: hypothetical protein ABSB66_14185 [Candidatus Acidiferrales bacterium]|jgi:hypothetical protein